MKHSWRLKEFTIIRRIENERDAALASHQDCAEVIFEARRQAHLHAVGYREARAETEALRADLPHLLEGHHCRPCFEEVFHSKCDNSMGCDGCCRECHSEPHKGIMRALYKARLTGGAPVSGSTGCTRHADGVHRGTPCACQSALETAKCGYCNGTGYSDFGPSGQERATKCSRCDGTGAAVKAKGKTRGVSRESGEPDRPVPSSERPPAKSPAAENAPLEARCDHGRFAIGGTLNPCSKCGREIEWKVVSAPPPKGA
jgi:hypothetical protein